MPATTDTRSGLSHGWDDGDSNWGGLVNTNFERLSRIGFQFVVEEVGLNQPPNAAADGESYLVGTTPAGDWSSASAQQIAYYNGTAWSFYTADEGMRCYDRDTDALYAFKGSTWEEYYAEPWTGTQAAYDLLSNESKQRNRLHLIHA